MYGEKGRMNGRFLIGGVDDVFFGFFWIDFFGNKVVEVAYEGFVRLNLILVYGLLE